MRKQSSNKNTPKGLLIERVCGMLECRSGQFGILFAVIAPVTIVAVGGSVDVAVAERLRADLQTTLDNATLAATSVTQTATAQKVISDFVRAEIGDHVQVKVSSQNTSGKKTVTAQGSFAYQTYFLHLFKLQELQIVAASTASEYVQNVEISLALDISGSMVAGSPTRRIDALRPAARKFVQDVLNERTKLTTTINLIPYSGQVSLGQPVFNALTNSPSTGVRKHNQSSCIGDRSTRFSSSIPNFRTAEHIPHFGTNPRPAGFEPWQCPDDSSAALLFSNDEDALEERIADMKLYDGTGTHIAMRWAIMTLDNRFNSHLRQMKNAGVLDVDTRHLNRPLPYNAGSRKVIVLMTDGEVWHQQRPTTSDPFRNIEKIIDKTATQRVLREACTWAKTNRIEVYTIGYEVTSDDANDLLRDCATSPSHYYAASISNIDIILANIAGAISGLKLTQ